MALTPVSVIVFPGGHNWPIWAAQEKGHFAAGGLEPQLTPTPNSVFQLKGLIEGRFDIAHTAIDNVVAYMEGQGEAELTVAPDIVAFMGGDSGFLSLVTLPEVKSFADLKERTLSVDAMTTGYAFVLFDLLKRAGLTADDYKLERAGGVLERWAALKDKKHAGTMLVTPFDIMARAMGLNVLQYAIDVYGHYQGLVGAARRQWAADNAQMLTAYIRAYRAGVAFLREPGNKDEAVAILRKNLPQMSAELAAESHAVMTGPRGFSPDGAIDTAGIRRVLELRSEYGRPKKPLTDPARYYELAYFDATRR